MTHWSRALLPLRCGGCNRPVAMGEPIKVLQLARTTKRRCVACAGPAPPDLPSDIATRPPPPLDMTKIGLLSLAWSREPGEDG